ncbi:hypothetical protein CHCC20333_3575 [Bacillus paralicheniformis]|uniref:hypothetical protein n=1 Tax=Bacillus paralicheniformis TaxID=1648923 RepID=UPI0011BF1AF5|nr:hypothetical protein [Bacillus paralicheniformis]TWK86716.1 hypothetical protein CHCC20333_3575 [Bacillus paralicheniformis]
MSLRLLGLICFCTIFIGGCSDNERASEDASDHEKTAKTETVNQKENSTSDSIDENCAQVYSKEECEQFVEYYKNGEGQKESETEGSEASANSSSNVTEKEIYEKASWLVKEMFGAPEKTVPATFENSYIEKRNDGLYYIHSSYIINGTSGREDAYYEFEMLMDENFKLIDAYFPGSTGRFSRPMVYDKIKNLELPEKRSVSPEEEKRKEKNHEEIMEKIYGKDKVKTID